MHYEFLHEIDAGEGSIPTVEDGLDVQRVIEAVVESDKRGRWIEL